MTSSVQAGAALRKSARFWDRMARRYARQPVSDEVSYQKKLDVTREYFRPDMEVFEFGCGTGSTAIAHAPYVAHIHAVDMASAMVEIATGKARSGRVDNVTFEQATIDEFNAVDTAYDAVLGMSILHLVNDLDGVINKVYGMLKPGGIFVTSTPCLDDSHKFLRSILPIGTFLGLIPRIGFFSRQVLEDSLIAAGFKLDYQWQPGPGKAIFIVATKSTPQ